MRLSNWSRNLALAHAGAALWRTHAGWFALQGAGDAQRPVPHHGGPSTGPRTPEGLQRIVKARTVHGRYGAEMRELRRLMRLLDEEQRRVLELVK